ncbi:MAG TPA: hypothetical protein EYP18_12765, partial [Desulfobacterales bacterium]|nr:hypothetical protein [Desulfobacterales bacterium]
ASVIRVYPSLVRAMDTAREHIITCEQTGKSIANGSLILASSLSLSKGRFNRSWHAPPGGLWGCLLIADTFLPQFRNFLPLIPGIACCEALHQEGASTAAIRWVNDVLIEGKKQAGFLIEGFCSPVHKENYHLLGSNACAVFSIHYVSSRGHALEDRLISFYTPQHSSFLVCHHDPIRPRRRDYERSTSELFWNVRVHLHFGTYSEILLLMAPTPAEHRCTFIHRQYNALAL